MKRIRLALCGLLLLQAEAVFAGRSEISTALDRMAARLSDSYRKGAGPADKARIAVFKFNSNKDLEKKRVGFAVSELLTRHFVGQPGFTVVERLEISKVFEELKFSQSGVVDPDDAVKIGKLLGADILVLGSVEKLGSKYHVNARVVRAETAEVLSAAYEALPADLFEEEAREYIVLVPGQQRIGFYALYNWRHNRNNIPASIFVSQSYPGPCLFSHSSFNLEMPGFGLRYYPTARLILDLSVMSQKNFVIGSIQGTPVLTRSVSSRSVRVLASRKTDLSDTFALYIGAGAVSYTLGDYVSPLVQVRIEYFLQARVGISLSAGYDLINRAARLQPHPMNMTDPGNLPKAAILDKYSLEPSISLYF